MEFKGTKGEWFIKDTHICCESGIIALRGTVRQVDDTQLNGESWLSMRDRTKNQRADLENEREAKAKLIAAAPDLLNALQGLLKWSVHLPPACNDEIFKAQKAIKKALEP